VALSVLPIRNSVGCFILVLLINSLTCHASSYYAAAEGLSGDDFKLALHEIIDQHRVLKYTARANNDWYDGVNLDVWEALVYTDSACTEIVKRCPEIQLLYLNKPRLVTKANRGEGKNDAWDREHVWPKSRGFKKKSQPGYTDLHHLRPADRNINSAHGNYGYDEGGVIIKDKLWDGSEVEIEARLDIINKSFEPTDAAKGQVARMLFYMAVRYETGDKDMPDLVLKESNEPSKEPWIGDLCTLLDWHNDFPVIAFERRRNNRVMEIQGNRNPFIDRPQWANDIWGEEC